MTLPIKFTFDTVSTPDLYRLRNWGDPILVQQAGLSAKFEVNGKPIGSNFNPIPLWLDNNQWSAIAQALIIPHADVMRMSSMQDPSDGFSVDEKMRWMVYDGHGTRPMWTKGGKWFEAPQAWYGTMAFGNNIIQVDDQKSFMTKLPNEDQVRSVSMYRLVCFRNTDWGKTHKTHPHLIHKATEVNDQDKLNEYPRGTIYSPLWSPLDWDYSGTFRPQGMWVPVDWVTNV